MSDLSNQLTQALTPFVESGAVPGLVALVARGDEIDQIALGVAEVGGSDMTFDSVFRIASITKPITAMATLALVGDGLIGLDDPVDSPARSGLDLQRSVRRPRGADLPAGRAAAARGAVRAGLRAVRDDRHRVRHPP